MPFSQVDKCRLMIPTNRPRYLLHLQAIFQRRQRIQFPYFALQIVKHTRLAKNTKLDIISGNKYFHLTPSFHKQNRFSFTVAVFAIAPKCIFYCCRGYFDIISFLMCDALLRSHRSLSYPSLLSLKEWERMLFCSIISSTSGRKK